MATKQKLPPLLASISAPGYHRDKGEGAARGLYLQVKEAEAGGITRSWLYRYVSPIHGKSRWMGLGPADAIGLATARDLARSAREAVKLGRDPIDERQSDRTKAKLEAARRVTFGQCAEEYLAEHGDGWKNEKHAAQWGATPANYAKLLTDLPVAEIDTGLILKVLRPIWKTKTETASRLRGRIERILAFATVSEYRTGDNPARWRGHLKEMLAARSKIAKPQHHKALPYAEVPAFMVDLRSRHGISARALELTILTAARTGAIIGSKWSEFDLAAKIWTIPDNSKPKGGEDRRTTKGKAHRVPLTDRAIAILKDLPREGEYVFPGAKANRPLSDQAMLELVRGMIGKGYTVHGFRSSFRDWTKEQTNFPREIAELALAHVVADKSEAAYSPWRRARQAPATHGGLESLLRDDTGPL